MRGPRSPQRHRDRHSGRTHLTSGVSQIKNVVPSVGDSIRRKPLDPGSSAKQTQALRILQASGLTLRADSGERNPAWTREEKCPHYSAYRPCSLHAWQRSRWRRRPLPIPSTRSPGTVSFRSGPTLHRASTTRAGRGSAFGVCIDNVPTQGWMCSWFTYSTPDAAKDHVLQANTSIGPMFANINTSVKAFESQNCQPWTRVS
jgi:hypothetical protein